jgi:hypothetical protein
LNKSSNDTGSLQAMDEYHELSGHENMNVHGLHMDFISNNEMGIGYNNNTSKKKQTNDFFISYKNITK